MPSSHLILCRPLFLLPSIFPIITVFTNESALHIRWPSWSFCFNITPSNEHFTSGGQAGVSASTSVLPMNNQDWSPLGWTGWISMQSKGLPRVFSKRVFAMISVFSWQNSVNLCPASFCTPRPNLPVTPGISWVPTFAFQSPIMKRTSFWGIYSKKCCECL